MPSRIQAIPPNTKVLGAYATPDFNTSMSLLLVLFSLIFKASKAEVARSNRAGQATY
jgi:hypothetical protein